MIDLREDQAAGLRRLFRRTPPVVAALFATGRERAAVALRAALAVAGRAERVILLDEAAGEDSLAAQMGLEDGADLLNILDARINLHDLLLPMPGLVGRVPVAAAALALPLLDEDRRDCLVGALAHMQRHSGFMLIHSAPDTVRDPSPFVRAAPRRLLVAEVSATGGTEAYQLIKAMAGTGVGSLHVAVCGARGRSEAAAFYASLESLVHRHVGVALSWLGEVERDDIAAGLRAPAAVSARPVPGDPCYLRELVALQRARSTTRRLGDTRPRR